jgi:Transposase, Mutator family
MARRPFSKVKEQWGRPFPSAVQVTERDLDSLLTFFQFDATYWTVLRTTNPIERLNKEFKRRTRVMEVTGGEISTYRCLVYVSQTMEYRWSFHPLSQWSTVYTQVATRPFQKGVNERNPSPSFGRFLAGFLRWGGRALRTASRTKRPMHPKLLGHSLDRADPELVLPSNLLE